MANITVPELASIGALADTDLLHVRTALTDRRITFANLKASMDAIGWSPEFSVEVDGARRVLRVVEWVGGSGVKPNIGEYVGSLGLVANITDATNIRGPAGSGNGDLEAVNNLSDVGDVGIARTNLNIGNVDNTSDLDKPVSTATQAAIDLVNPDVGAKLSYAYLAAFGAIT